MSGGSWDYLYCKIEEAGYTLKASNDPLRRAFGAHMILVAKAMHDIEWVDSCDKANGDERAAIEAALGQNANALELKEARKDAEKSITALQRLLYPESVTTSKP